MVDNISNISLLQQASLTKSATKGRVLSAIKEASARTGVDFAYLVNEAAQESSFNPEAKASGSSATGLYQFIDQTWLRTIKENGEEFGLGEQADKITIGSNGVATVANEADKKAILALRKDPEVSSLMAAALAKDNKESLEKTVSAEVGATEMYLAHFLGSGGAAHLLKTMQSDPTAKAADILPSAAKANRSVFYDSATGEAKSVAQIYQKFAQKFDQAPDLGGADVQVASATAQTVQSAQSVESSVATNITLTSLSRPTSSVSLANGMSLSSTTTSTPFAAMILAQMDMDTFGLDAKANMSKINGSNDEARRKSILSTLANVA
ncbi:MAG: transglycosylase SLT domain-containing protein [Alphaproteobacteria bacterium]|nr:transglycosylase SLT domain-containing protein [Alphaproteobacteria bacterium]